MAEKTLTREQYLKELPEIVKNMDGFRQGSNKSLPVDIHLGDMLQEKYGITQEDYFKAVGFNPKVDTMENIYSMPNPELRCRYSRRRSFRPIPASYCRRGHR